MTRERIIGLIILVALFILGMVAVRSCQSGNDPQSIDDVPEEGVETGQRGTPSTTGTDPIAAYA